MDRNYYYRAFGQLMGIKGIPETHQGFAAFGDRYQAEHFGFDAGGLAVSEATLKLMVRFGPGRFAPTSYGVDPVSRVDRGAYWVPDPPGNPDPPRYPAAAS